MIAKNPSAGRDFNRVVFLLALLPLSALIFQIIRWHVDVPFWDSWLFVPLLEKSYQGTLSLKDFLAQYNDSRPFFHRILMLGLARASDWDTRWELAANVVLAAGVFAVLASCLRSAAKRTRDDALLWLIPLASLQIFSMNQAVNWLHGASMGPFLSMGASVASLALLSRPALEWPGFCVAAAAGVVALFSFSAGAVCWPAGAAALALNGFQGRPVRIRFRGIWYAMGFLLLALTLFFYRKPGHHPDFLFFMDHPVSFFRFLLGYLGSPAQRLGFQWARVIGAAGLLFWSVAAAGWVRSDRAVREIGLPYFTIGLYALGSGVLTAVARAGFGERASMAFRYLNMVNLFWLCLAVLIYLCDLGAWDRLKMRIFLPGLALGMIASSLNGAAQFPRIHARLEPARRELFVLKDEEVLKRIYPGVDRLRQWAAFLRSRRLSVYRAGA